MVQNPIFKWAGLVFGFWWVFLFLFGNMVLPLLINGWKPSFGAGATADHLRIWSIAIALGATSVILGSLLIRQARQQRLAGKAVRGMQSMLGRVPLTPTWLDSDRLPRKPDPTIRDADLDDLEVWKRWKAKYASSHPQHVTLAKALVTMYEAKANLPATHHAQGHGSRSLGSHCMAVAAEMERTVGNFRYRGLTSKRGKVLAQMQRADGIDLTNHPLVFIVGLAHDMGKIEGYEFKDGAVVGCLKEHDLLSARMMGRLDEAWGLPHRDREALLVAIGYYHHPMSFPLDRQKRVADDLGCALMQHLHDTDIAVSDMEESEEYDKPEMEDLSVYDAFVEVVSEVNRINGSEKQGAVGQKWKDLVVLKESDLRRAMAEKMGLQAKPPEELEQEITAKLVVELRARGLMATGEDIQQVAFQRGDTQIAAPWSEAIVIRPGKILPGLTGMPDYDFSATAVIRGNKSTNAFVDTEIEGLRRPGGDVTPAAAPATTAQTPPASAGDDDDDFSFGPNGEVIVGGVPLAPPPAKASKQAPRAGEVKAPPVEQAAAPAPAKHIQVQPVAPAAAPAAAPTGASAPPPAAQQAPAPTVPVAPQATAMPAAPPEPAPPERPKAADRTEPAGGTESKPTFAMKNLQELTAAASASRVGGKGSRLEAFYNELIRSAPPPSEAEEAEANEAAPAAHPAPVADASPAPALAPPKPDKLQVPEVLARAIERGEVETKLRPSGLTIVLITPNLDPEVQQWVARLPESKEPNPASWLQLNAEHRVILLQKGWESHVG